MLATIATVVKRAGLALASLICAYLLAAVLLSLIGTRPSPPTCEAPPPIHVASNGVHLDLILPVASLPSTIRQNLSLAADTRYVAFGWGDRGFYLETPTWSDLEASTAIRAMLLDSETVMHVTAYRAPREHWVAVPLCASQLDTLRSYIAASFTRAPDGRFVEIPNAGYTPRDAFYEAEGSYSCLRTCNNWVNAGLKAAEVPTAVWSPFDWGVLRHL